MIWISLLPAFFARDRLHSAVIFAVLALAFGLLVCVDAVRAAFSPGIGAGDKRLVISSAYSLNEGLPASEADDLRRRFPEIATFAWASWVGGYYETQAAPVFNIAVSDNYFDAYPEFRIAAETLAAFLRQRDAVIVGKRLASAKGWHAGQRITLRGVPRVNRASGDTNWEYEIVGLFDVADDSLRGLENQFFSRWDYFDASAPNAGARAGWLIAAAPDAATAQRLASAIDAATRDSRAPTRTQTEEAFQRQFADGIVDVATICRVVMIAILLFLWVLLAKSANAAIKRRSRDLGILKSLGFRRGALFAMLVAEAIVMVLGAAALGMAAMTVLLAAFGDRPDAEIVLQPISKDAWWIFFSAALALSLLASLGPAFKVARASSQRLLDGAV